MRLGRVGCWKRGLRRTCVGVIALVCAAVALNAQAALLPEGFFDRVPMAEDGQAAIQADYLSQDRNGIVTATGQVDMAYLGYFATADKLIFNQRTQDVQLIGNVVIRDPDGIEYSADQIDVTGNFKRAILEAMVMVTPKGAMITSTTTNHDDDTVTILENGTYSPCGTCIDSKGRRIGWRVRTERMIYDEDNELIDLEQPILEVLGYPVAWLPWIRLPDPSKPRANGFRLPSYGYSEKIGLQLEFPYFYAASDDVDVWLTPTLMSRQGFLMRGEVTHRVNDWAQYSVDASGLYQLDRSAFAGTVGDRDWRGALQASTKFTPTEEWKLGGSYSVLSDRAYLGDYLLPSGTASVNEVYAEYLTADTFAEVRVQEFYVLGNATQADQNKQGLALPTSRFEHVQDLGADYGRFRVSARGLGVHRAADSVSTNNGVSYVLGHEETKVHGTLEAGWEKQWVTAPGVLLTPYVGMRLDAAYYDGASALFPGAQELYSVTPIAALDVRYPFVAVAGGATHIIEPIAQLVYRGGTTAVGITNDNAQSFVFDDTNLFSFNRFSGSDRQETGLRANIGGHYLANLDNGANFDLVAGQSYHLAGTNALAVSDAAMTGTSTGLGKTASDIVVGARASWGTLSVGGKLLVDPGNASVVRTAIAGSYSYQRWSVALDYSYAAADLALGALANQQDLGGSFQVPLHEYWYAKGAAGWDITKNQLINHSAGVVYDDGYFSVAGDYSAEGANLLSPASQTYKITFKLKGPDGSGYSF